MSIVNSKYAVNATSQSGSSVELVRNRAEQLLKNLTEEKNI